MRGDLIWFDEKKINKEKKKEKKKKKKNTEKDKKQALQVKQKINSKLWGELRCFVQECGVECASALFHVLHWSLCKRRKSLEVKYQPGKESVKERIYINVNECGGKGEENLQHKPGASC